MLIKFYRRVKTFITTLHVKSFLNVRPRKIKIASVCVFSPKGNIKIGNDFFAGENLYVSTNKYCNLYIGDAVMFGPNISILGGNHDYKYTKTHLRYNSHDCINTKSIVIEDGVWIGANSTILSGTTISEGSVVGACSLVSHFIPPYVIAVGSPAKKFSARFSKKELKSILENVKSLYNYSDIVIIYEKFGITLKDI